MQNTDDADNNDDNVDDSQSTFLANRPAVSNAPRYLNDTHTISTLNSPWMATSHKYCTKITHIKTLINFTGEERGGSCPSILNAQSYCEAIPFTELPNGNGKGSDRRQTWPTQGLAAEKPKALWEVSLKSSLKLASAPKQRAPEPLG